MPAQKFDLSVIIPTCDMAAHLPALAASMRTSGLLDVAREVIFVDDGSRDDTPRQLAAIAAAAPERVRVLTLPENQGRYLARLHGARAAHASHLLYLDTRLSPPPGFAVRMAEGYRRGSAVVAVRIDVSKSIFNLYWERTHAFLFARNRRDERAGFSITPENYDRYVTGTGGLLCRREEFLAACAHFGERALLSDDTFLMRELVKLRPIFVRDDWFVYWEPRQSLGTFLKRLWDRGPGFVEYHVVARRGLYFHVLVAAASYLGVALALTARGADLGPPLLAFIPTGLLLSTAAFARGPFEFIRLAPLHLLVCVTAAAAVAHGLVANARRKGRA